MLMPEVELVDRDRFRSVFTTPVQPSCAAKAEVPACTTADVTGMEPARMVRRPQISIVGGCVHAVIGVLLRRASFVANQVLPRTP
jgi:hypothetical protein